MPKLPQIKPEKLGKILQKNGYKQVRQKGSHRIYVRGIIKITLPIHNKPLKKGTLGAILKVTGLKINQL